MNKQEIIDILTKEIEWSKNNLSDNADEKRGFIAGLRQAIFLIDIATNTSGRIK